VRGGGAQVDPHLPRGAGGQRSAAPGAGCVCKGLLFGAEAADHSVCKDVCAVLGELCMAFARGANAVARVAGEETAAAREAQPPIRLAVVHTGAILGQGTPQLQIVLHPLLPRL
jgi:hypothetical protein